MIINPEQWLKVGRVFNAAVKLDETQRNHFLERACGTKEWLRREVESLLNSDERAADFIENPIFLDGLQSVLAKQKELVPGQEFGRYKLLEMLAAGGMGEVYLAEDPTLERKVALKFLPQLFTTDSERVRRLEMEARSASALNHPNILTIYEIGEIDSIHYIATEYIDGPTLREQMAKQPLSISEALNVATQIASALDAAHAAGIVHRDIKPENIMLRTDGIVKVVDFGIARHHDESVASEESSSVLMGTVKYMSPEQTLEETLDARSDIWSLGVVLYEMLAGRVPFDGKNDNEIRAAIVNENPPSLSHVPAKLQHLVDKALCKRSEDRYQTAKELRDDLEKIQRASRERLPRFLKVGLAAAFILVLVLAAGRIWTGNSKSSSSPGEIVKMSRLTTSGNIVTAAISADGNYLAYVTADGGEQSLRARAIDSNRDDDRLLFPSSLLEYVGLSFSPDGKYIYCVVKENGGSLGSLYRIPATGGTPENLQAGDIETPVTFSPDGKFMAFVSRDPNGDQSLNLSSADGSKSRKLAARKYPDFFRYLAWSPDGENIACVTGSYLDGFFMTLVQVRIGDGVEEPLTTKRWWSVRQLAWRADGRGLYLVAMDQATGTTSHIAHVAYPGGEVQNITSDLNDYRELTVVPRRNALIAVHSSQNSDMWVASVKEGLRAIPITHTKYDQISGMAWTPNGSIVHALRRAGENWSIWTIKADGSARVQLTKIEGNDLSPAVSPDGRYVVFTSTRSGSTNIWRMDADGGNLLQLTYGRSEWWPGISRDGRWVIYTSFGSNQPTLWKIPIDGGSPVQLTSHFSILPVVSPAGNLVACYSWDGNSHFELKMAVMQIDDGQLLKTFTAPNGKFQTLDWISDGQSLAYIQEHDGKSNLWAQSIAGGPPRPITAFTTQHIFDFAVSPDGQNIAMARGSIMNDIVLIEFR
jgi:eukaryotic-like serine/threonine-protein kinase